MIRRLAFLLLISSIFSGCGQGMKTLLETFSSLSYELGPELSAWQSTASIAYLSSGHTSLEYNGYIYVLGGHGLGYKNIVIYADVNADGTISAWNNTTPFNTPRSNHCSFINNGYMYIIGGTNGSNLDDVQYALINPDGTVGTWNAATSIPLPAEEFACAVWNNYVYITGGKDGSSLSDVYYAAINNDGTIGSWTATASLPLEIHGHTCEIYNNRIYIIEGFSTVTSTYHNGIYFANINPDGSLSSWTLASNYLNKRAYHTSVIYNGYLYIIGGFDAGVNKDEVIYSPINPDGSLGTWTIASALVSPKAFHSSVYYDKFIYNIGGNSTSGVYYSEFIPQ